MRELAERVFAAAPRAPSIDGILGWILLARGEADKADAEKLLQELKRG